MSNAFDKERYYTQLGRMISTFSLAERSLKGLLAQSVGIDDAGARAIFSGTRADQASSFLKRSYRSKGAEIPKPLLSALDRFAVLNRARNDLVHSPIEMTDNAAIWSDVETIVEKSEAMAYRISNADLEAISKDAWHVNITFLAYFQEAVKLGHQDTLIALGTDEPWRYKPPQRVPAYQLLDV